LAASCFSRVELIRKDSVGVFFFFFVCLLRPTSIHQLQTGVLSTPTGLFTCAIFGSVQSFVEHNPIVQVQNLGNLLTITGGGEDQ
jgi:hypothetical protein